jgi:hypothetical protein
VSSYRILMHSHYVFSSFRHITTERFSLSIRICALQARSLVRVPSNKRTDLSFRLVSKFHPSNPPMWRDIVMGRTIPVGKTFSITGPLREHRSAQLVAAYRNHNIRTQSDCSRPVDSYESCCSGINQHIPK